MRWSVLTSHCPRPDGHGIGASAPVPRSRTSVLVANTQQAFEQGLRGIRGQLCFRDCPIETRSLIGFKLSLFPTQTLNEQQLCLPELAQSRPNCGEEIRTLIDTSINPDPTLLLPPCDQFALYRLGCLHLRA